MLVFSHHLIPGRTDTSSTINSFNNKQTSGLDSTIDPRVELRMLQNTLYTSFDSVAET